MADELDGSAAPLERWDARLAGLETRLEMLESGIKAEVERVRLVAENLEGLSTDFQGMVGGTRNLVDLVNDIGDRLSLLHSLEATVTSASEAVADRVRDSLAETTPLLERVSSQLTALGSHLDERAAPIDLGPVHEGLGALGALGAARTDHVVTAIEQLRNSQPDSNALVAPLAHRLDQLLAAVADVSRTTPNANEVAAGLSTRLDAIAANTASTNAALSDLHATATIAANQAQQVATALAALQDTPDGPEQVLAPVIERLAAVLDEVSSVQSTVSQLAVAVGALSSKATTHPSPDHVDDRPAWSVTQNGSNNDLAVDLKSLISLVEALQRDAAQTNERLDKLTMAVDLKAEPVAIQHERSEPLGEPRGDELGSAGAALVASAASAMTRLEARMEDEFDTVAHQTEALGSLVAQSIEAIERIEQQIVGVQPVTEKMRAAAARTLESLRTSRTRNGPHELNR